MRRYLLLLLQDIHTRMQDPENWPPTGICSEVEEYPVVSQSKQLRALLMGEMVQLFERWPEYSGRPSFPVQPLGTSGENLYVCSNTEQMWDRETSEYAQKRWSLLEFMISELRRVTQ